MHDENRINPGHTSVRTGLRVAGPIVLLLGLGFTVVGFVDFVMSMNRMGEPRLFWCGFVGLPLIFVGVVMTSTGFMGAILRYHAAEGAPVGKDTFNYVAQGVKPGIKDVTQAVVEGAQSANKPRFCTQCGTGNDADAKFCKSCGRPVVG